MITIIRKCTFAATPTIRMVRKPTRLQHHLHRAPEQNLQEHQHRGPHRELLHPREHGRIRSLRSGHERLQRRGLVFPKSNCYRKNSRSRYVSTINPEKRDIDLFCSSTVPSMGPISVEANATSSTTIVVKWGDIPTEHQNGQIEGFKVYYGANSRSAFQYKTIESNSTYTTTLTELRKYVQYHVQVLAYTRLGDGALSVPPVRVQTFEDGDFSCFQVSKRDWRDILCK